MKKKNIFWGLTFIFIAITTLGNAMGWFESLNIVRLAWTTILVAVALSNLPSLNFGGVIFPLVIAAHVNKSALNLDGKVGAIYLTAFFLIVGLNLLFKNFRRKKRRKVKININGKDVTIDDFKNREKWSEDIVGQHISIENNFNDSSRYVHSDGLITATIENNFGSLHVYFDQVTFDSSGTLIRVENNFGKTVLYLPRNINLRNNITSSFGSVRGEQSRFHDASFPNVSVDGDSTFGDIEIRII